MELTNLIVSSAVGGAAGSFIREVVTNGVQWLIELVTAQSPEMQAIAKNNMGNFVIRLAKRVETLEKEIPAEKSELFKNALNHPSSALLIKAAIVDSATTDNNEKHELLAELIAQRLTANADDMIALAGTAACAIVNSLSSRQIKILAVLCTICSIRPLKKFDGTNLDKAQHYLNNWWQQNITPLLVDAHLNKVTQLDYEHLVAMGCARISIGTTDLVTLLSSELTEKKLDIQENAFNGQPWYETIKNQWKGLGHLTPTSVGQLIGILHRDAKLKSKTQINW